LKTWAVLAVIAGLVSYPAAADLDSARSHLRGGNIPEALAEFERLAEKGDVEAQASLAELYFIGRGIAQDQEAAVRWFGRAADGGHVASQVHLGMISAQAQDFEQSAKWFQKAAEAGDSEGMSNLAALYFRGLGVERNAALALDWFAKAAALGDPADQLQVGLIYIEGLAGEPDVENGLLWIRRAANQGYSDAQLRLAAIYTDGAKVPKDAVRAYMWLHRASMMGIEQADGSLQMLAGEMTAEQIAEAKRLAAAWKPGAR
jgi:TPR repeat protein